MQKLTIFEWVLIAIAIGTVIFMARIWFEV